ncbi:MAG: NADH:ubiquinone reductase (Na(+)-transporting) subunit C [Flavisolibacter sp.]|nr:NADH:ubiquinone reductase (Na(+)-transporting) subunit C [Flavisolibacter sp.]
MNQNSSSFTFIFASVMVVVVAVLLSLAAIGLGPYQERNVKVEKMQNILSSIGIKAEAKEAEKLFNQYLKEQVALNKKGEPVSGVAAFDIDLKKELDKEKTGQADKQLFPLFVFNKDGNTFYVIPMRGKGLWGPIWGYVALDRDMNTIHGASFGHKGETPGLGAEIAEEPFQKQFVGKKILDDSGNFTSVRVIKGGATPEDMHGVDAISGGTITSNGVTEMLHRTFSYYVPYFKTKQKDSLALSNQQ